MNRALSALVLCAVVATGGACSEQGAAQRDAPRAGDEVTRPMDQKANGTPPALNGVESRIVDALDRLSLRGERAELPGPQGASMWVPDTEPDPVHVVAHPVSSSGGEVEVLDERRVGGSTVQTVRFPSGIERQRFDCDGTTYGVGGAAPATFGDIDAFVAAFVEALGCDG